MHPTLLAVISRAAVSDSRALRLAERVGAVAFVTALTAAAAQISAPLPFTPVPLTFQPMVVLLGGAVLGARLGMSAQALYLALGVAGLPVFAASPMLPQGAARLLGPTGGYLMAYPIAAFVTGALAEHGLDRRYMTAVAAMTCGLGVIFTAGVLWLSRFTVPPGSLGAAIAVGFSPFIVADFAKLLIAAGVMPSLWWLVGRRQP